MNRKILNILFISGILISTLGGYLYALPDLTVTSADISFSETCPETGQTVTITVTVSNAGTTYVSQVYPSPLSAFTSFGDEDCYAVYESTWYAQYIVAPSTFYLGKVSLRIDNQGDTADSAYVQIRNHDTNSPYPDLKPVGITDNYLVQTSANHPSSTDDWHDFNFDTPIQLTEGTTYWLCFGCPSTLVNRYRWWWGENTSVDMIAMSRNNGNTWYPVTQVNGPGITNFTGYYKVYRTTTTTVQVYDGNPSSGGMLIHTEMIERPIDGGGTKTFSFIWIPTVTGTQNIYVKVDQANDIAETSDSNNTAYQPLPVMDTFPRVVSAEPDDGSVGVTIDCQPVMIFSEAMNPATITTATVKLTAVKNNLGETISVDIPGSVAYEATAYKLTFIPETVISNNYTYRFSVSASLQDIYGQTMNSEHNISFTTVMKNTQENVFQGQDNLTQISLRAGSVPAETFYLDLQLNPPETNSICQAQSKVTNGTVPFLSAISDTVLSINLYGGTSPGQLIEDFQFTYPVTVTIPYTDDNNGIVRGTNPPVHESTLALYWLNEESNIWVRLPDSRVDTVQNVVSAEINHFSVFAILGESFSSLQNAYAFPVPFKPNDDPSHTAITFTGLSSRATIKIYTITGELVKTIEETDGDGINNTWDARNVASGLYLYSIENDRENKKGQLLIIK